jgi:hypothetical protein
MDETRGPEYVNVSALRTFSRDVLRKLDHAVIITTPKPLAGIVPYKEYMDMQAACVAMSKVGQ